MKKFLNFICTKVTSLLIMFLVLSATSSFGQCRFLNENFNVNPVLSPTNVNNTWYPDRYPPAGFTSAVLAGNNVLKISIDGIADGALNRPGGQQGTFYNTQGRKFNQCGGCITKSKADLYIPADWATKHRRSDMWATAFNITNNVTIFPIIGFRNPDAVSPGIYFWDGNVGWVNTGVAITYDSWYNLEFRLVGANLEYLVNNIVVGTIASGGSTYLGDIIMQAYNFNDPTLLAINQSADSYDAYWDNLITSTTNGNVVINTNTNEYFCSIQSAINATNTLNGHTITVGAGTYAENVVVNKSLTILGPNNLISPNTGVRVAEAIITGGLTVDNAASKTVNIEGFKFVTVSSPMSYNGNGAGTINANLTFNKNIVNANSGQLVVFTGTATNTATVVVDDNLFQGMASNAMQIGPGAPSHGAVTTTITNNTINTTVNSGINTDGITSSLISANLISNTTQQGIQVAGAAGNVTISQNVITNSNTSGDVNRGGIRLRGGSYTGPVTVINNIVSGSVNGVIVPTGENITGKAITVNNNNLSGNTFGVKNAGTGDLNATCNWYGTANAAVVATKVSGNVTYVPYLSSGTDASPAVVGFQPAAVCAACTLSSVSLGNNRYIFFGIPGLPGASGTLTPIITDGLAPFSYNWSASTDPSVSALTVASVTPTGYTDGQAFDYTVIVTDANGCTATATVNITYFNINCSSNGNNVKVKVCHIPGGNPTNCKTICVSINAYQALLNNGSYLGNCLPNCEVPATRGVVDISNYIVGNQDFKVKVFNNPTETYFRLYVSGDLYEKISIRVSDMYGRVIEQKQNINSDEEIRIGDRYVSGLYIVEVVQGMSKKVIKLVKQ
ncbi:MAG: T9SS type A sorting domain-containing protein [Bacteroidota bacterium]|nr:T9SS type A sorting domain-containing protein [Bacteroidota bacterium]